MEIRLRTTGEILDDAGHLVLADAPLLLALAGLFTVPAALVMLLLLNTTPPADWLERCMLPAAAAIAIPLTGLGSAACQSLFLRRAEEKTVTLSGCLFDAIRNGLGHMTARVIVWLLPGLGTAVAIGGPIWLFLRMLDGLPGLVKVPLVILGALATWIAVGLSGALVHAILAEGKQSWWEAWKSAGREGRRQSGKIAAILTARIFLWLVAVVNLYLLVRVVLWAGEAWAGLDLALASLVCTSNNPAYLTVLGIFSWLLLVPYGEACYYLLHVDARARYEGLDLWYRVRRLFPVGAKGLTAAIALLILAVPSTFAADARLEAVQTARKELGQITKQIKTARPYDGKDWLPQLRAVGEALNARRPGRYRWFAQALNGFEDKTRPAALKLLGNLDRRLDLIEKELTEPPESPPEGAAGNADRTKADIRALLPADSADPATPATRPRNRTRPDDPEARRPVRRDDPNRRGEPVIEGERKRQGPGAIAPSSPGGSSSFLVWMAIAGVTAIVVVLAVLLIQKQRAATKAPIPVRADPDALSLESLMSQAGPQGGAGLWRQADDLAQSGRFLDAVRTLYLGVLALLHKADLIRYAPTRTNGEYIRQLRPREEVCGPFRGLTGLFEIKWYGERSCEPADYDRCRRLAEEVRQGASK